MDQPAARSGLGVAARGGRVVSSQALTAGSALRGNTMKNGLAASITFVAVITTAGTALAGPSFTTVRPAPSGELGHAAILQNIYGGSWAMSATTPVNVTNGVMTAQRVADAGVASPVALATGTALTGEDSAFAGQSVVVTVKARYAGDRHMLGWIDDTAENPVFQPIINSESHNIPVELMLSGQFRWALQNISTGKLFTSRASDNRGIGKVNDQTFDHLVTYHLSPKSGPANEWALFWEDRTGGQNSDFDFNDAVFIVQAVPSPGVATLGGIGMVLLSGRRRRAV